MAAQVWNMTYIMQFDVYHTTARSENHVQISMANNREPTTTSSPYKVITAIMVVQDVASRR